MGANLFRIVLVAVCLALLLTAPARARAEDAGAAAIAAGESFFKRYVELGQNFDAAIADLYSDDAVIRNTRRYPTGQVRELTLTGAEYKRLVASAMPLAKARGDVSRFSSVTYEVVSPSRVRISAARFSVLKNYTSPIAIVIEKQPDGAWLVVEELSESRP